MISMVALLLFLGLIAFGPKKTIEFAQEIGRLVAHLKHTAGQLQKSVLAEGPEPAVPAAPAAQPPQPVAGD